MSTRAHIYLKLKPEDTGITLNINNSRFDGIRPEIQDPNNTASFDDLEIPKDAKYLKIYCHHDGYPRWLGNILGNCYKTYERVLALMLFGDTSSVAENSTDAYAVWEDWEDVKPDICNQISRSMFIDYTYLFDDNQWTIYDDKDFVEFESI